MTHEVCEYGFKLKKEKSAVVAFLVDDILFFSNKANAGIGVVFWFDFSLELEMDHKPNHRALTGDLT